MSRVLQGIVQGIGFLGAGAIMVRSAQHQVEGLTTAANIWSTAGIGIIVGWDWKRPLFSPQLSY
ncbi:MgtC/SapB family protein [Paracoccus beibuensis]|uniref:MgtC/SapB family protein n=1 Tax=Paracoccus beibuensis TaxID=547602 RepID=UPI0022408312|nr:MgtC/SapB family protein [Paracoccus beibuensis]